MEWLLEAITSIGRSNPLIDVTLLLIVGITNGVLFAPASEHIYFLVYSRYGAFSVIGAWFAITNSLGHYILFKGSVSLSRLQFKFFLFRYGVSLLNQILDFSDHIFTKYDRKFYALMLLRCIPFFHSAVSVMASKTSISDKRFITLTVIGNFQFFLILGMIFNFLGDGIDFNWLEISFGLIAISGASFIIKRVAEYFIKRGGK